MDIGLPKTIWGWLSVILVVLFVLATVPAILGIVSPSDSPPVVEAVVGVAAGLTGLFALTRNERSLMVIIGVVITLPISLMVGFFIIGYALSGE